MISIRIIPFYQIVKMLLLISDNKYIYKENNCNKISFNHLRYRL